METAESITRDARIRGMVERHAKFVSRALRSERVPDADLEDEVQRTFIIVADRVDRVRAESERAYLFQVAQNLALHARRTLARRREMLVEEPPEVVEEWSTPEHLVHRRQLREVLDAILADMTETLRRVFLLYEVEQRSMREIATLLGVPRGTVASRLRRAREHFRSQAAAVELV